MPCIMQCFRESVPMVLVRKEASTSGTMSSIRCHLPLSYPVFGACAEAYRSRYPLSETENTHKESPGRNRLDSDADHKTGRAEMTRLDVSSVLGWQCKNAS